MTAAATEAWLDIIPALPLARGVPVAATAGALRVAVVVSTDTSTDPLVWVRLACNARVDGDFHPRAGFRIERRLVETLISMTPEGAVLILPLVDGALADAA